MPGTNLQEFQWEDPEQDWRFDYRVAAGRVVIAGGNAQEAGDKAYLLSIHKKASPNGLACKYMKKCG
ncbi:MAG: hypothetical protein HYZ15_13700 [Sphingobacteriales bacterium]|nr:hypothetical protein [Sphingobacteriales bacterium]